MKIKLQWRSICITAIMTFVVVLVFNKLAVIHNIHDSTDVIQSSGASSLSTIDRSKLNLLKQPQNIQQTTPTTDHAALLDEKMKNMKSLLSGTPMKSTLDRIPTQSSQSKSVHQPLRTQKTIIISNVSIVPPTVTKVTRQLP